MSQRPDCDVFQDQLDALLERRLPAVGLEQLRLHAAACPECAMQLRVHEHLVALSVQHLEAAVSDELVGSVLPRVQSVIGAQGATPGRERGRRERWSRFVPALAAATLLLCFSSGLLYWELRQLREQESVLIRQVTEQGRRLAQLDAATSMDPVARAAGLAGRTPWERALARRTTITVSELEQLLRSAPVSTTIFTAAESEALLQSLPPWLVALTREALSRMQTDDGITAGELIQLIGDLDIDTERRISTSRILAVSRQATRLGRS